MTNVPGPQHSCGRSKPHPNVWERVKLPKKNRSRFQLPSKGSYKQKDLIEVLTGKRRVYTENVLGERVPTTPELEIKHKINVLKELDRKTIEDSAEKLLDIVLKDTYYQVFGYLPNDNHKKLNAFLRAKVAVLLVINDQVTPELIQGLERLLSQMEQDETFVKKPPAKKTLATPLFISVNITPVNNSGSLNIAYVNLLAVYIKATEKLQIQQHKKFIGHGSVQKKMGEILKL